MSLPIHSIDRATRTGVSLTISDHYLQLNEIKATLFYNEWVLPSLDWSYGNRMIGTPSLYYIERVSLSNPSYKERLQTPVELYNNSVSFEAYNILFRQGMAFEIAFFESAIGKHPNDSLVSN